MKHFDLESCIEIISDEIREKKKYKKGDWKKDLKFKVKEQAILYCNALYPIKMRLPKKSDTTKAVEALLTVPNPEWHKRQRQQKPNQWLSKNIFLGVGELMPPGTWFWHQIQTKNTMPNLFSLPSAKGKLTVSLRENQIEPFEQVKNIRSALVDFRTGSGKTVIAAALTQYWGTKTLILAHSVDNVKYFKDTLKEFCDIDCGAWYGGEKVLKDVTITTHATAKKQRKMFADYGFENLIVDEADIFFTEKARDFLCRMPCSRKIAFTGTIQTDPDDFFLAGELKIPSLVRFYGKHIRGKAEENKNPIRGVFYASSETEYLDRHGFPIIAKDWILYREQLDNDEERFENQLDYLFTNTEPGDHSLVLFDRVEQVEKAQEFLKNYYKNVYMLHGSVKKQLRIDSIDNFKKTGGIMVAQYKTAGRGLDLPACNKLFTFFPVTKESTLQQMVGRVIRWMPNKKSYVYDWKDSSLKTQWKKRKKTYITKFNYEPKKIAEYKKQPERS